MNDVLSFHKEELDHETTNLVHLRHQAVSAAAAPGSGTGLNGEWILCDTFDLLCDEVVETTERIDILLRLEECEKQAKMGTTSSTIDEADITIAKQWRGWRDGYICWHLESQRYKLDFMRPTSYCERTWA